MFSCLVGFVVYSLPTNTETKDIVFARYGTEELKLDVTTPAASRQTPVMVLIHGGGWVGGIRDEMNGIVPGMTSIGFACVQIDYRAAPKAQFPAQLIDAKASIRWVKENAAKYNLDPTKIAVLGYSEGGHLAALLATTGQEAKWDSGCKVDSSVTAAISFGGSTDLPTIWRHRNTQTIYDRGVIESGLPAFIGGTYEQSPAKYRDASPIFHITRSTTPMLLMHGEEDVVIPKEQPEIMFRVLQAQGVESELLMIPGAGHGQLGSDPDGVFRKVATFLKKNLKM